MERMLPGYRFYPTEEELVSFYLPKQMEGENGDSDLSLVIPVVNIFELEPQDLPNLSGELCNGDTEQWFFFVPRQEREIRGGRPSRTTSRGYWKATGSPSYVYSSDKRVIGLKKTMVFYEGKAPTGRKTKWKMNEYRAIQEVQEATSSGPTMPQLRKEVSLCRVYVVSGSFRAFDRRPLGVGPSDTANYQTTDEDQMDVTPPLDIQPVDHTRPPPSPRPQGLDPCQVDQERSGHQVEQGISLWDWEEHVNWPQDH